MGDVSNALIVVSDTSPLRALLHLNNLDLLHQMFGEVYVPPGVIAELRSPRRKFASVDLSGVPYIRVQAPTDRALVAQLQQRLDLGESQSIALALEIKAAVVLMDEASGRAEAKRRNLAVLGVLGLLRDAKLTGWVPAVKPLIDELIHGQGFFVQNALRARILSDCGETP
jgi:predicted nucleic acid-binding protein